MTECPCLLPQYEDRRWPELQLHVDPPGPACPAWNDLLALIDRAAEDGRETFAPVRELGPDPASQLTTLPPTIGKLTRVKRLDLHGSRLVRLPPEVGRMTALESLDAYTAYRLHWYPYEITRYPRLADSRVSTRALYGNRKYRPPFPHLPQSIAQVAPDRCSGCDGPFDTAGPRQVWVSLRVAADVLPLLVHACSDACVARLPPPPEGYVRRPHTGGLALAQPERGEMYR